jgi:uncharacterized protein YecE (DUF72 family)
MLPAKEMRGRVRVGPAGWQYADWSGVVYPTPRPAGFDALAYLSSYFDLIEINSTFYRVPSRETCASWAQRVSHRDDFGFSAKLPQTFTHGAEVPDDAAIDAFKRAVAPLHDEGRLVCLLAQFPWSFKDTVSSRDRIQLLHERFLPLPLVVELRHGGWAERGAWDFLAGTGITICGIDQPLIGRSLRPFRHLAGSAGVYFRLHGRNARNWFARDAGRDARYDYHYSSEELQPWAEAIVRAAAAGPSVSVVLNNHFRGQAPANAFELMAMLSGERVPAPAPLRKAFPRLAGATVAAPPAGPTAGDSLFDGLD